MNGVPVARRMIAPGNDAGMYIARLPASARYIRSLYEPNSTSGGLVRIASRTAALSGFAPACAANGEGAGNAHLLFEEAPHATHIGVGRDDGEGRAAEEILRHAAPQIPDRLDRGVLLPLDERLGIDPGQLAQLAQEVGGREQADRRLQVRPVEFLAEQAAELAIHADVHVGVGQPLDVLDMRAEREHQVDLAADALDQAADFGEVGRHVEGAVDRADDVDPRLGARGRALAGLRLALLAPNSRPQPVDRAVGALPLVLVDGARNEAQQVRAFRRDAAADHFGDAAGHHHRRHVRILRARRRASWRPRCRAWTARLPTGRSPPPAIRAAAARRCSAAPPSPAGSRSPPGRR